MKIGILKEIKDQEKRVGLTTNNVKDLINAGQQVFVEHDAGKGCGFDDSDYCLAGAIVCHSAKLIVESSDIIVKIKEPILEEYYLLDLMKNKVLYTFLHLAANKDLALKLMENSITGISYDTIEDEFGRLPMLKPMSEIAGRYAIELTQKHSNKLGKVFIVGGGVAGTSAAFEAIEQGAIDICIYENNDIRAKQLEETFGDYAVDVASCIKHVTKELYRADTIIGAALVKGQKAPIVITEEMTNHMKKGAFMVDISIDQGGCMFGSRPTSHTDPVYELNGLNYCCIPNMPGQKPREATEALTNLTVPCLIGMVSMGVEKYMETHKGFQKGLNTYQGKVVNEVIAKELNL